MPLYLLRAVGSPKDPMGIRPAFPDNENQPSWVGVYDVESGGQYVVRTDEPVAGLEVLEPGTDVGFDYSSIVPKASRPGAPEPEAVEHRTAEPIKSILGLDLDISPRPKKRSRK